MKTDKQPPFIRAPCSEWVLVVSRGLALSSRVYVCEWVGDEVRLKLYLDIRHYAAPSSFEEVQAGDFESST